VKLPEEFKGHVDIIEMPALDISSTELRNRIHNGQNINPWMTTEVRQYIQTHKLYRNV